MTRPMDLPMASDALRALEQADPMHAQAILANIARKLRAAVASAPNPIQVAAAAEAYEKAAKTLDLSALTPKAPPTTSATQRAVNAYLRHSQPLEPIKK